MYEDHGILRIFFWYHLPDGRHSHRALLVKHYVDLTDARKITKDFKDKNAEIVKHLGAEWTPYPVKFD